MPAHCLPHSLFWLPRLDIIFQGLLNSVMESVVTDGVQTDPRVSQTKIDGGSCEGDNKPFSAGEGDNFLDVVCFDLKVCCDVFFCCFSVLEVVAWVGEE